MVPQSRLIVWSAILFIPVGVVAGLGVFALAVSGTLAGLFVLLLIIDAVLARRRLAGVGVELPAVVRLQRNHPGEIVIKIRNESRRAGLVRIGLAFPPEIVAEQDDMEVMLPDGAVISQIKWSCVPGRRGQYFLDGCYLEKSSPLGFWAKRCKLPGRSELRVYPNLFDERKHVAALFLNRGRYGIHSQRIVGKGREFEKLRDYTPGDSLQDIHWKASAKRGRFVTKVFQIERTQEVYVVLDSSRLSARDGAIERFLTSALVLALAAEQQGDLFGLVCFNDKVSQFVRAKSGKSHFETCRDALYTQHAKMVSPDFDELSAFLRTRLRKRALLVFLTTLDDPLLAESFSRNMDLLCRQHLILVNMLKPRGVEPLFSGSGAAGTDAIYEKLGGHLQWRHLNELEKRLQRHGVVFKLLDHENLCAKIVAQYVDVKARQLI